MEKEPLNSLKRPEPHHISDVAGHVVADGEVPAFLRNVVTDELDFFGLADA